MEVARATDVTLVDEKKDVSRFDDFNGESFSESDTNDKSFMDFKNDCEVDEEINSRGETEIKTACDEEIAGETDESSVASTDSNSETEQIRCRICHSSSGVLYRPCACSGSIAHVHQECLLQWLSMKNIRECEVCHTTYVFTPIYSTDAPRGASILDVAHWLVEKAMSLYPKLLRCSLVLVSWLLLVPLITAFIWRLCFVASIMDLVKIADVSPEQIWRGLQTGAIICFVVLMVTVVVATFRELMREEHHMAGGQIGGQGEGLFMGEDELLEGDEPALDDVVEDVPFSTWIGFTGPIKFFFVHITSVVLYNAVFLAVAIFIPLQAGRLFLSIAHVDTDAFARWIFERFGDALQAGIIGEAYTPTPERYAAMYDMMPVKDASLLGCGYLFLMVLATVWGPLSAFFRLDDLPFVGFLCGLLRYVMTGFKFGALVGFELGVFPVYLGCCLDILVLDLVDSTFEERKKFFHDAPLTSVAMHWFLGINFILYVSFIASLLRRTIKRRILSRFLRYPDDPDFQPFHDFIYVPLHKHCKRLCVSGLLYTLLVILFIHVPAKVFTRLFPSVAPLRWRFAERSEVPVDLLLFHFAVPAIMGHVDLRGVCLGGVKEWFIFISSTLGIDTYLLREDVFREAEEIEDDDNDWDGEENDGAIENEEDGKNNADDNQELNDEEDTDGVNDEPRDHKKDSSKDVFGQLHKDNSEGCTAIPKIIDSSTQSAAHSRSDFIDSGKYSDRKHSSNEQRHTPVYANDPSESTTSACTSSSTDDSTNSTITTTAPTTIAAILLDKKECSPVQTTTPTGDPERNSFQGEPLTLDPSPSDTTQEVHGDDDLPGSPLQLGDFGSTTQEEREPPSPSEGKERGDVLLKTSDSKLAAALSKATNLVASTPPLEPIAYPLDDALDSAGEVGNVADDEIPEPKNAALEEEEEEEEEEETAFY